MTETRGLSPCFLFCLNVFEKHLKIDLTFTNRGAIIKARLRMANIAKKMKTLKIE